MLSRVEVALENDDEDPEKLSRLAGLHLGPADVTDAFNRFKISKLYSSFFALPEVEGQEVEQSKRQCGPRLGLGKLRSSRTPGAASSHAPLVRAMTQSLHTVPQINSSKCMWKTWVSWGRHV